MVEKSGHGINPWILGPFVVHGLLHVWPLACTPAKGGTWCKGRALLFQQNGKALGAGRSRYFHFLRNMFFSLLALKGIYHFWRYSFYIFSRVLTKWKFHDSQQAFQLLRSPASAYPCWPPIHPIHSRLARLAGRDIHHHRRRHPRDRLLPCEGDPLFPAEFHERAARLSSAVGRGSCGSCGAKLLGTKPSETLGAKRQLGASWRRVGFVGSEHG